MKIKSITKVGPEMYSVIYSGRLGVASRRFVITETRVYNANATAGVFASDGEVVFHYYLDTGKDSLNESDIIAWMIRNGIVSFCGNTGNIKFINNQQEKDEEPK